MDEAVVDDLRRDFSVHHDKGLVDRPEELADLLRDARALIVRNRTQVRGALLDAGARLEAIGRLGVGLDNIDVEACASRGIAVLPATGANDISVAEWVIAAMLILIRGAFVSSADVLAGKWPRERLIGGEILGALSGSSVSVRSRVKPRVAPARSACASSQPIRSSGPRRRRGPNTMSSASISNAACERRCGQPARAAECGDAQSHRYAATSADESRSHSAECRARRRR